MGSYDFLAGSYDALTADEVTRIRDVVLSRCTGLSAQSITVVEVK